MHEVSVMKSILDIALAEAARAGAGRIALIRLRAGVLSGVVPESMEFAFEVLRGDDPVTADARLEIDRVSAGCCCRKCGCEFEPSDWVYACPLCGSLDADIKSGRELELSQMEVF